MHMVTDHIEPHPGAHRQSKERQCKTKPNVQFESILAKYHKYYIDAKH